MASQKLPATTYSSSTPSTLLKSSQTFPLARKHPNTRKMSSSTSLTCPSTTGYLPTPSEQCPRVEKNEITPRTTDYIATESPQSDNTDFVISPPSSRPSSRNSAASNDTAPSIMDDLYGISDDDHIDAFFDQLRYSPTIRRSHRKIPSLIIPEPDNWPTIQNLHRTSTSKIEKAIPRPPKTPLSPANLAKLANASLQIPKKDAAPSLDGASSTDEHSSMTCPSTPDSLAQQEEDAWNMPMQLNAVALSTLQTIIPDHDDISDLTVGSSLQNTPEMASRGLHLSTAVAPAHLIAHDPVSAISVPSPGGFFASLNVVSRNDWGNIISPDVPSSATAEWFYKADIPPAPIREQIVECSETDTDGPPTAIRISEVKKQPEEIEEPEEQRCVFEYDDYYGSKLVERSTNLNSTDSWLNSQQSYSSSTITTPKTSPRSTTMWSAITPSASCVSSATKSPKKTVRFSDDSMQSRCTPVPDSPPSKSDSLFYHAFQHIYQSAGRNDAILYGDSRAEALQLQRLYLTSSHIGQLNGDREVRLAPNADKYVNRALPQRPDEVVAEAKRAAVMLADIERQALEQIKVSVWNLQAVRQLNGGSLLDKSVILRINLISKLGQTPRILDLGGQPTADWGWAVALTHRECLVHTAMVSTSVGTSWPQPRSTSKWQSHRGPSNHRTTLIQNTWSLPFDDNSFDIVSARSLHTLLRIAKEKQCSSSLNQPFDTPFPEFASEIVSTPLDMLPPKFPTTGKDDDPLADLDPEDEYTHTLTEIYRILKPNGILSFSIMDAELFAPAEDMSITPFTSAPSANISTSNPSSKLIHISNTFATRLKDQHYDPQPSSRFLPRLHAAGFSGIRRAWSILPVDRPSRDSDSSPSTIPGLDIGKRSMDTTTSSSNSSMTERSTTPSSSSCRSMSGGTSAASAVTGLVGSLAFERWVSKLAAESGEAKAVERAVAEVGQAIEAVRSAARAEDVAGLGWRCLNGWARKSV